MLMEAERKSILLQVTVLLSVLGFFLYSYFSKPDGSFNQVYRRANDRLDSIALEVAESQKLIRESISKLDAIRDSALLVKKEQAKSNTSVSIADANLRKQLQIKEQELSALKSKYQRTIAEKNLYRDQLDSLAETIGN